MTDAINIQPKPAKRSAANLFHRIARYRGAVELGWYDFITMFRRSFFGPIWPMFQMTLWIATLTFLFHERLGDSIGQYALYVGVGLYAWEFISAALNEGIGHMTSQGQLLKNVPVDLSMVTVRKISLLTFRALSQAPVPIILLLWVGEPLNAGVLLLIPVMILFLANAYAILTVLSVFGVFFRDLEFFMPSVTRILFFTTPIFWQGDIGFRKTLSQYNPFSYYLELVRAPLNGAFATPTAWMVVGACTAIGFLAALWVQSRFRNDIIYRI